MVGGVLGAPEVGGGAGDVFDVIGASHVAPGAGAGDGVGLGEGEGAQAAAHGAIDAEFFSEGAGIYFADTGDAVAGEVGGEGFGGAPVAHDGGELAHDEAAGEGGAGLGVSRGDAVVADLRGGHGDDLPEVGGVGENLLVARHGGVEHTLAGDGGGGTKSETVIHGAIFQSENCGLGGGHRNWTKSGGREAAKGIVG